MTLENLLNTLIQRGWKPFNMEATGIEYRWWPEFILRHYWRNKNWNGRNVRNLVSKESWLWQFCVENEMVKEQQEEKLIEVYDNLRWRTEAVYDDEKYEYRIIESALKDESEIEDFLLNSIKLD